MSGEATRDESPITDRLNAALGPGSPWRLVASSIPVGLLYALTAEAATRWVHAWPAPIWYANGLGALVAILAFANSGKEALVGLAFVPTAALAEAWVRSADSERFWQVLEALQGAAGAVVTSLAILVLARRALRPRRAALVVALVPTVHWVLQWRLIQWLLPFLWTGSYDDHGIHVGACSLAGSLAAVGMVPWILTGQRAVVAAIAGAILFGGAIEIASQLT